MSIRRSVVLVGLPGAGKSAVAPHAARLLGTTWCDLDQRIAAAAQRPIAGIFDALGERRFRELERDAMEAALAEPAQLIATGGGWAAEPGNLDAVGERALVVYLSVSIDEAARRLGDANDRPLLVGASRTERLRELFGQRELWYRRSAIEIATDAVTVERVAMAVANVARQSAGW